MRNTTSIGLCISILGIGSCLPKYGNSVLREERKRAEEEQKIEEQLEIWTASGYFSTVSGFTLDRMEQYSDRYPTEVMRGADIALKYSPNLVYMLAAEKYQEDMKEDMDSLIYALQNTRDNGFSYSEDLDYDE